MRHFSRTICMEGRLLEKILILCITGILLIYMTNTGMGLETHKKTVKSHVTKGIGAWIYGQSMRFVNEINAYNKSIKNPDMKIRYLFCYAGSVESGTLVGYDSTIVPYYKQKLPDCRVYPNIDGYPSINGLSKEQIQSLARQIADKINSDDAIAGLHLDIEPYEPTQLELMEEFKKYSSKPVNLSVSREALLDPKLFQLTNFVVLMNYDFSPDPAKYTSIAQDAIENILEAANQYTGKVMIGLPFIATHHEYQYMVKKTNIRDRKESGFTMADYLAGGLKDCKRATRKLGQRNFVGISIWAFLPEEEPVGSYPKSGLNWYYPVSIGLSEWQQLKDWK